MVRVAPRVGTREPGAPLQVSATHERFAESLPLSVCGHEATNHAGAVGATGSKFSAGIGVEYRSATGEKKNCAVAAPASSGALSRAAMRAKSVPDEGKW